MILSEHLTAVRDILNDPDKNDYDDALIARHTDAQLRRMFREQVDGAKQFQNFSIGVRSSQAKKLWQDVHEYALPNWVFRVADVFSFTPGNDTDTFDSPYLWTTEGGRINHRIEKSVSGRDIRWTWEGHHTIRLWNSSQAIDLLFMVAKTPPRVFQGTIASAHTSTSKLYLPATLTLGTKETLEGAYINAEVVVTSTASATSEAFGESRRCVFSDPNLIDSGTRFYELTFDSAYPEALAAGDVVETQLPLDTEHSRLLALAVAYACMDQNADLPGKRSIAPELQQEWVNFRHFATSPRDSAGPTYYQRNRRRTSFDRDRDRIARY